MYLKSLTLKGFKSFADRAHMVFEPGLTVIVGPNGSGKSNVSDAIRWVLGEQSAKQLRGAAMEDVVFAGSSARKPVGMAEVDLTLDNSDHVLPVDFEEVVVTRRMYRSGESEYLINGAPARLLDITDILHDTGLGKETHSIIGQGKLDSILASKPEERRALIEEAAGISKHKRRRERSLKRLESMESHLQRVLDVQKEVSRQLKPLERQVDKAKRASEISERARELRCILAVDDLRRLQARWDEVQRAERERSSERDVTNAVVAQRTQELDNLRLLLEEKGIFAGDLSEQRRRAQLICEKLEGSLRLLDEKGRSMAQRTSQLSSLVADDEARGKQILEECERARVDYDEAMAALKTLRERSSETKQTVDAARKVRRKAEEELDRARSNYRATQRDRDMCAVALAKAQDAVKNAEVQDGIFATRANQLDETITQLASQLSQAGVNDVKVYDVSKTHGSYLIGEAFRASHLVFCSATYNMGIFTPMKNFLNDLVAHNMQNRKVSFVENGTWSPASGQLMQDIVATMPGMVQVGDLVTIRSTPNAANVEELTELAGAIAASLSGDESVGTAVVTSDNAEPAAGTVEAAEKASDVVTTWKCTVCGYIYECEGEELPADFICPLCGKDATFFELVEE